MDDNSTEFSLCTFNILAPCYKRMSGSRESSMPNLWVPRIHAILKFLLLHKPTVIAIQEFWFDYQFYQEFVEPISRYYYVYTVQRPSSPDGVALLVKKSSSLTVVGYAPLYYMDVGRRVALMLHVCTSPSCGHGGGSSERTSLEDMATFNRDRDWRLDSLGLPYIYIYL